MNNNEAALRIFIVDDEPPARNRLRDLLNDSKETLALEENSVRNISTS